jgi:hypothetical protein
MNSGCGLFEEFLVFASIFSTLFMIILYGISDHGLHEILYIFDLAPLNLKLKF